MQITPLLSLPGKCLSLSALTLDRPTAKTAMYVMKPNRRGYLLRHLTTVYAEVITVQVTWVPEGALANIKGIEAPFY